MDKIICILLGYFKFEKKKKEKRNFNWNIIVMCVGVYYID